MTRAKACDSRQMCSFLRTCAMRMVGGLPEAVPTPEDSTVRSRDEQIKAILSWDVLRWATCRLRDSETMDSVRFRDLIDVTEIGRAHV